jgi:hypothetical protein
VEGKTVRLAWAIVLLGCAVLAAGSVGECAAPTPAVPASGGVTVELREDLGREEFIRALSGEWVSAWGHPSREFVSSLTLAADGTGTVAVQAQSGAQRVVTGPYAISFLRPPAEGSVTLAEITIGAPPGEQVVLGSVSFGLHNALPGGPYLRVDGLPSAVLQRQED